MILSNTLDINKPIKNNVIVNYTTNLTTHIKQNPLINPNHQNIQQTNKVLSPIQQINVIGKGTDPSVIIKNPNVTPYIIKSQVTNPLFVLA